eukprot:1156669-Pelagomonas_calceolata.AAC.6
MRAAPFSHLRCRVAKRLQEESARQQQHYESCTLASTVHTVTVLPILIPAGGEHRAGTEYAHYSKRGTCTPHTHHRASCGHPTHTSEGR